MAAKKSKSANPAEDVSFEDAIAKLESIVESMEHGQLSLEDLVSHYEEGSKLLNRCEAVLKSARGRIELITLKNRTEIGLASDSDLDHSSGLQDPADLPDATDDDDDIRLF